MLLQVDLDSLWEGSKIVDLFQIEKVLPSIPDLIPLYVGVAGATERHAFWDVPVIYFFQGSIAEDLV